MTKPTKKADPHTWPAFNSPPYSKMECLECGAVKLLRRYVGNDGYVRLDVIKDPPPVCTPTSPPEPTPDCPGE